jgi:hypothetical protein
MNNEKKIQLNPNFAYYLKRGPVQQPIQKFFLTKSQAKDNKRKAEEELKKNNKVPTCIKSAYHDFSEWSKREALKKTKEQARQKRQAEILTEVYRCVRYWVSLDGSVHNYIRNYLIPEKREYRIMFLEKEHTKHNEDVQKHIDETVGDTNN